MIFARIFVCKARNSPGSLCRCHTKVDTELRRHMDPLATNRIRALRIFPEESPVNPLIRYLDRSHIGKQIQRLAHSNIRAFDIRPRISCAWGSCRPFENHMTRFQLRHNIIRNRLHVRDSIFNGQPANIHNFNFPGSDFVGKHMLQHTSCARRNHRSDSVAAANTDYTAGQRSIVNKIARLFNFLIARKLAAQHLMTNDMAEGYEVKPAANMLDESLFVKETSSEELFDMTRALNDGEYTATVDGQEGPMTVKVTIAEGRIAAVEIVENHETQTIAGAALENVPAAIEAENNATVSVVTGATLTSNRIMNTVAQCLEQAAK